MSVNADVYYIDFGNRISKRNIGGQTVFYNQGGVIFKGVEGEGTFQLTHSWSIYANGSVNSATFHNQPDPTQNGLTIANSPAATAAGGLIYDHHGLYAALLAKYVGPRWGDDPEFFHLAGYATAQLSASYTIPRSGDRPAIKLTGTIDNLFDEHGVDALAGYTAALGTPLVWNIVPRNFTLQASVAF